MERVILERRGGRGREDGVRREKKEERVRGKQR